MSISIRSFRLGLAAAIAAALCACNGNSTMPSTASAGAAGSASSMSASRATPVSTSDESEAPGYFNAVQSLNTGARPDALAPINTWAGATFGEPDFFHPALGDYKGGGQGQAVDSIHCLPTMVTNKYHIHIFLGLVYNGKQIAMPATLGFLHPGPPAAPGKFYDYADCFYRIHTHDSSGIVHVELNQVLPLNRVVFHLKDVLGIWGVPVKTRQFGPMRGPIHVFIGTVPLKTVTVTSYQAYKGNLEDIPLQSHEAIWIEVGTKYYHAAKLPPVTFYMEY
jgi:hypothetical protein